MKKVLISSIVSLLLFAALAGNSQVLAQAPTITTTSNCGNIHVTEIEQRREVTQWYFRHNSEGVLQCRLWSITEAKWLTPWTDC